MESSLEVDDYRKVTHDVNDNDSDIMATTTQTKMKPAWQTMPTAGNEGDVNDGYGNDISIMMAVKLTITTTMEVIMS